MTFPGMQPSVEESRRGLGRVIAVGFLGLFIDYYDFFIAGTVAGTVWPPLFFPRTVPSIGIALCDAILLGLLSIVCALVAKETRMMNIAEAAK